MPHSPVHDRYKSKEGYHAVPPSYTRTFMPLKPDLVFYDAPTDHETVPTVLNVEPKDESEGKPMPTQKAPSFVQTSKHVKTPRSSVKPVEHPTPAENLRKDIPKFRGHKHSWNRKACFVCKSLTHLIKDCNYYEKKKMVKHLVRNHAMKGNHQHYEKITHPHPHRHVVPTAVLTRSRIVPLNAARPVSTVVPQTKVQYQRPTKHGVNKAHSPIRRTINYNQSPKTSNFHQKVTTVKAKQHALKYKGVINNGCSRHMTGNISYLSEFKEINGGYVAFGGNPKGGKITRKGKIGIGKLEFDDVYFVKELKFNLFSVLQMCDKKNSVLFTDTECIVLSFDFKLPNDNHVLLRVPRENNTYNVDLKNIVPSGDLTRLFAKATLDESNLWHKRLGHIKFKTMNKLVKGNLVRGLPSKVFENNHTCVACKKGKQHRACYPLGKFDGKADEGFLVGYSSMNYQPVVAGNQPNSSAGIQEHFDTDKAREGNVQQYVIFPLWSTGSKDPQNTDADATFEVKEPEYEVHVSPSSSAKTKKHDDKTNRESKEKSPIELSTGVRNLSEEFKDFSFNSTNGVNVASTPFTVVGPNSTNSTNTFSAAGPSNNDVVSNFELGGKSSFVDPSQYPNDPDMPALEDITYSDNEEDVGVEANFSNLETNISVSPIPTTRVHKDRPVTQTLEIYHQLLKQGRIHQALKDPIWIEAMQEELLQFKMQKVWVLVDLPKGKRDIGSKWVFRNKKDERGIVVRNKAQLVAQGHTQEEGIYYEEVFAPVARIEAIRFFLAYASFMRFMVYKVVKALYGLHQAPKAWYETLANYLLENGFQRGQIDQTLFIKRQKGNILLVQKEDEIFINQDKYVAEILRKFGLIDRKSASTPIDTEKPLLKDHVGEDVDVHTYSMKLLEWTLHVTNVSSTG
nr:putative ribonuclease H-like domain-containing protein [Tanacetum cinerariifolium]